MECIICKSNDWQNVDEMRIDPTRLETVAGKPKLDESGKPIRVAMNMCICKTCGFVSYPDLYKTEEEIKEYYRKHYRNNNKAPSVNDFYSGHKKNAYHAYFLSQVFDKWKDDKIEKPVVCDIGAAYGMFLQWVRQIFPSADINGTELTESYRRCAWHEHKVYLDEDFDDTKKYDLISSYKVAEHQLDADKYLIKYKNALNDNGYLYISVPVWFDVLNNFGASGFDLAYYYDTNHINVWTKKLFETLLKKCGLRVIKENHAYYDSTYLCKRDDSLMSETPQYENYEEIIEIMKRIKQASHLFQKTNFTEAIQTYPKFPLAWKGYFEKNRAKIHAEGKFEAFKKEIDNILILLPDNAEMLILAADFATRYKQYELAMSYLDKAIICRPEDTQILHMIATIYRTMSDNEKDPKEHLQLLIESAKITNHLRNMRNNAFGEMYTWLMRDFSQIPMPPKESVKQATGSQ